MVIAGGAVTCGLGPGSVGASETEGGSWFRLEIRTANDRKEEGMFPTGRRGGDAGWGGASRTEGASWFRWEIRTANDRKEEAMFPTRILLATDGSEEAAHAARMAAALSEKTGSELHVVYVEHLPHPYALSEATTHYPGG